MRGTPISMLRANAGMHDKYLTKYEFLIFIFSKLSGQRKHDTQHQHDRQHHIKFLLTDLKKF